MMTLVTNITHTRAPPMYKCLTSSLTLTHLPIESLTPLGHSHALYFSKMGAYNSDDTDPYIISLLPFLLGTGDRNNEFDILEAVMLTPPGPLGKLWRILAPRIARNLCLDSQSLQLNYKL